MGQVTLPDLGLNMDREKEGCVHWFIYLPKNTNRDCEPGTLP